MENDNAKRIFCQMMWGYAGFFLLGHGVPCPNGWSSIKGHGTPCPYRFLYLPFTP
jgi:hypothetical protein